MLYRIAIEPLWGEARWQIMSECLLAFSVTVAFHLSCCTSPGRPNQSNIRGLPCSSTMPFTLSTWFLAVSNVHVLTAKSLELQTQETIRPVASLPPCPVPTFTSEGSHFHTEPVLSCVSMPPPQPTLFITLAVKAKYEHTYEYMNK